MTLYNNFLLKRVEGLFSRVGLISEITVLAIKAMKNATTIKGSKLYLSFFPSPR